MNHFIELPDGTIVNVAHVCAVVEGDLIDFERSIDISLSSGMRLHIVDRDADIYAYFESIAQKIEGGEAS